MSNEISKLAYLTIPDIDLDPACILSGELPPKPDIELLAAAKEAARDIYEQGKRFSEAQGTIAVAIFDELDTMLDDALGKAGFCSEDAEDD